jgi:hypothetical protein
MSASDQFDSLQNHCMLIVREVMGCGMNSGGYGRTEDRQFMQLFSCGLSVVISVWNLLLENDTIDGATVQHLLWALLFIKVYSKE